MLVLDASACAIFFWLIEIFDEAQGELNTIWLRPSRKSPSGKAAGGCFFSS
jgi:hypothetical protein